MKKINLEYQISNGMWISCKGRAHDSAPEIDRNDEFLQKCVKYNIDNPYILNKLCEEEIIQFLQSGQELRCGSDWYQNIRDKDFAIERSKKIQLDIEYRLENPKYETVEQFDTRDDER